MIDKTNNLKNKFPLSNKYLNISIGFITLIYFYHYYFGLVDYSQSAHFLFRDERLSYDGILRIYQSNTIKEFLEAVFFGGDLRYGRLFYNINAITSYIPYLIFHEQGQIIATRLTQFLAIFTAYYFLIHTFLQSNWHKLFAFIVLVLLVKTVYFINDPKPEPLQLLFFSLFLFYAFKNSWKIKPYIILLGICLGLKISFIPLTAFFIGLYLFLNKDEILNITTISWIKYIIIPIVVSVILIGYYFLFAENLILRTFGPNSPYKLKIEFRPILYKVAHYLVGFIQQNSSQQKIVLLSSSLILLSILFITSAKYFSTTFFKLFLFILIGIIICSPCIVLIPFDFKYLFYFIFDNRLDHGADNPLINYITWSKFFLTGLTDAPLLLFIAILAIPFVNTGVLLFQKNNRIPLYKIFLLLVFIFLSIGMVFLNVKRLWPHYLHIGYIFIILFYFVSLETKYYKWLQQLMLLPIIAFTFYLSKSSFNDLKNYANRSNNPSIYEKNQNYLKTILFLNDSAATNKVVYWDAQLFYPDKLNKNILPIIFYDNFNNRASSIEFINTFTKPDFIVVNNSNIDLSQLIKDCDPINSNKRFINQNDNFEILKKSIVVDGSIYTLVEKDFGEYLIYFKSRT